MAIFSTVLHEDTLVTNSGQIQRTKPLGEGEKPQPLTFFASTDKAYNNYYWTILSSNTLPEGNTDIIV